MRKSNKSVYNPSGPSGRSLSGFCSMKWLGVSLLPPGWAGFETSPGTLYCVLGQDNYFHSLANLMLVVTLQWNSLQSRREKNRNIPSGFMLKKMGLKLWPDGPGLSCRVFTKAADYNLLDLLACSAISSFIIHQSVLKNCMLFWTRWVI